MVSAPRDEQPWITDSGVRSRRRDAGQSKRLLHKAKRACTACAFIAPRILFRISHPEDMLRLVVFLCVGGAMIWFIHVRQCLLNQVSILLREAQARERAAEQHQEVLIHADKLATIGRLTDEYLSYVWGQKGRQLTKRR